MRALGCLAIVLAARVSASGFDVGEPMRDSRRIIAGRLGASPADVSARGLLVSGTRDDVAYGQAGGEVWLQGGLHFFQTSFGALMGAEADFSLGGASNERSVDGTLRDQRRRTADRDESLVWLTSRLGLRVSLSLPVLELGSNVAFRLGGLGGVMLEANGSRSFEFSPAFTAGAQLGFVVGPLAGLVSYLAIPTQGLASEQVLTSHRLGLELGLGPIVLGATVQLTRIAGVAERNAPPFALASQTLALHVGYRLPPIDVK